MPKYLSLVLIAATLAGCSSGTHIGGVFGPSKIAGPLTTEEAKAVIASQIPEKDVLANIAPVFPATGNTPGLATLAAQGALRETTTTTSVPNFYMGGMMKVNVNAYAVRDGANYKGSASHPAFVVGHKALAKVLSIAGANTDSPVVKFTVGIAPDSWAASLPEVIAANEMLANDGACTARFTRGDVWTAKVSCPASVRVAGEAVYEGGDRQVAAPANIDPTADTVSTLIANGGTLVPCRIVVNQGFMGMGGSAKAYVPKDAPSGSVTSMAGIAHDNGSNAIGVCSLSSGSTSGNGGDE